VALLLREREITRVRPLAGGLEGWKQRGFPVETSKIPALAVEAASAPPSEAPDFTANKA
jgi:3-mercaptopyruvate sulfurtransferase SseA